MLKKKVVKQLSHQEQVKVAKENFRESLKNLVIHLEERNEWLHQILQSPTPKWDSVKISIINY